MDYTKNHHLPQWVKSDRIMMDDFNQMCRDIEAGLNKNQSSASSGVTNVQNNLDAAEARLSSQIAQATQTAKSNTLDGLRRAAYNHLYLAEQHPSLRQSGLFSQGFDKDANVTVSGMLQCESCLWTCNGQAVLNFNSHVRPTVNVVKSMYGTDTLEMTYSLPYSAMLRSVQLYGGYSNNNPANKIKPYTLFIYNSDNNQLIMEKRGSFELINAAFNLTGAFFVPIDETFHKGNYRFRLKMDKLDFTPNVTFRPTEANCMDIQGLKTANTSIRHTLAANEVSAGGVSIVQFSSWGAGGAPSLVWDGITLQPAALRSITNNQGFAVTEAEFRRYTDTPASSSLTLNITCASGGEVRLYRWGAILS